LIFLDFLALPLAGESVNQYFLKNALSPEHGERAFD
jgi:hypothetical protein